MPNNTTTGILLGIVVTLGYVVIPLLYSAAVRKGY